MKPLLLILLFSLLFAMPADAEFYKWIDDDGVFHVVDDLHKVPPKDRDKLGLDPEALKEEIQAPEKSIVKPMPKHAPSPIQATGDTKQTNPAYELYGDKTLQWWKQTLSRVKYEKSELETAIRAKEEYIRVYINGVRLQRQQRKISKDISKIKTEDNEEVLENISRHESDKKYVAYYTQDSVDRYNRYVEELPEDKEKLEKKKDYLEKLLRRAKNAGVPKKVRGD